MKKAYNIICPVCNKDIWGAKNLHHVFGNAYKKKSEEDLFLMNLHPECHINLHSDPTIEKSLKIKCQEWYEKEGHTRDEFIKRYGQSYIL